MFTLDRSPSFVPHVRAVLLSGTALLVLSCADSPPVAPKNPGESVDSKIVVTLTEVLSGSGRSLLLRAKTKRIYPCVNYHIENNVARSSSVTLVTFQDVTIGDVCFTATGPATAQIDLGSLAPGTYPFVFQSSLGTTRADLLVENGAYRVVPMAGGSVEFPSPVLQRIPDGTVWGLIGNIGNSPTVPYDSLANSFLDSLAAAGAEPVTLEAGDYGPFSIDAAGVMHWPGTHGYYYARPYVRHYEGASERLGEIVDFFGRTQSQYLSIRLATWKGENYYSWLSAPEASP